jgi:hypothetical protein
MIWKLSDALETYRRMISPFHNAGYLLLVYGSILNGQDVARDLDLMAVPWRPSPTPPKLVFDDTCSRFHLSPAVGPPYVGLMKSWSHTASDIDGRIIDFQFRKSDVSLEQSYEFSMRRENEAPEWLL